MRSFHDVVLFRVRYHPNRFAVGPVHTGMSSHGMHPSSGMYLEKGSKQGSPHSSGCRNAMPGAGSATQGQGAPRIFAYHPKGLLCIISDKNINC